MGRNQTRQDMIDYIYVLKEDPDDHLGFVKIGHSIHPMTRPDGYQAGNWRELIVVFVLIGGQPLETEISQRFAADKVGSGGDEWYKVTPELLSFFYEKMSAAINEPISFSSDIEFGNGPSQLPIIELGVPELRPVSQAKSAGSIQSHDIVAASQPKSRYERLRK
jgi:hypothetical protein